MHVSAKDMATGKEQTITITFPGLSDERIEHMVRMLKIVEDEEKFKQVKFVTLLTAWFTERKSPKDNEEQMDESQNVL